MISSSIISKIKKIDFLKEKEERLKEDNRNTKYREALENTTAYQIQYDSM
jgi:archaellum biogenesis protein FlaJ (TadC family)